MTEQIDEYRIVDEDGDVFVPVIGDQCEDCAFEYDDELCEACECGKESRADQQDVVWVYEEDIESVDD
jgi:hypothetical protein